MIEQLAELGVDWEVKGEPTCGLNSMEKPFYSADVYSAIVWDRSLGLKVAYTASIKLEFFHLTFF